ncbi:hypothetical protein PATA110615_27495 [Paenibacillus taichungensis]
MNDIGNFIVFFILLFYYLFLKYGIAILVVIVGYFIFQKSKKLRSENTTNKVKRQENIKP